MRLDNYSCLIMLYTTIVAIIIERVTPTMNTWVSLLVRTKDGGPKLRVRPSDAPLQKCVFKRGFHRYPWRRTLDTPAIT
ncbi:MAG: hypothetical protein JWQ49_645 [Edaphobacter sp.]|nr:hypothetical protein [Edaphobacter sp.]